MSKSTADIEGGIRAAVLTCSLEAAGLWLHMRYVIESSDRPGHLRQNGRPMVVSQLARVAGCDAATASRLLAELGTNGLGDDHDQGWHSPLLGRIAQVRADGAARVRRHKERVLANTQANAKVTPGVTPPPPPPGSPPETPSYNPHPRESSGAGGNAAKKPEKPAAGKPRPEDVPIPAGIDTPEFCEAWASFGRHRRQANDKNWTAEAAARNLGKCVKRAEAHGVEQAVADVNYSIERAWRGVFPAKDEKEQHHGRKPAKSGGGSHMPSTGESPDFGADDAAA